ncbi:MAG: uroporphyrinogen-III C-methyltransferase [Spirosomataceae bacterium]
MKIPKLTVVGAGPGDPELITLKAINALRDADVVLYDALANEGLLDYCIPTVERIFVGKRGHQHSISQDSINFMIVEKAYEKGHVVRLKGGDPYIFGRGNEEIVYAKEHGLETAYVPGISSVLSGGNLDIPLTARGVSDGFWVITGHKSDGSLSEDVYLAAQSNATVIILMGMSKINQISQIYNDLGRGNLPAAIIQNATLKKQKYGIGQVGDLSQIAQNEQLSNPAIIIIGEVVNHHFIQKNEIKDFIIQN